MNHQIITHHYPVLMLLLGLLLPSAQFAAELNATTLSGTPFSDIRQASYKPPTDHTCSCDELKKEVKLLNLRIEALELEHGFCHTNEQCTDAQYCQVETGMCGSQGICMDLPEICPSYIMAATVCGCDGETYASPCEAAKKRVNVAYDGECSPPPKSCTDSSDCTASNEYCAKPVGQCSGDGICSAKPEVCTTQWNPVCGCDGRTYGNTCNAAGEGVSLSYEGTCQ